MATAVPTSAPIALILVVVDDPEICELVEAALTARSYDVRCAANPTMALYLFAAGLHPDLIVVDLSLARGSMERLRTQLAFGHAPVIALDDRSRQGRTDVMDAPYVEKPFDPGVLADMVGASCRRPVRAPAVADRVNVG
jgi:DNA-binding response OmpR family regulator